MTQQRAVQIPTGEVALDADLVLPGQAAVGPREAGGLVAFAHGSGSGRGSPRNLRVAGALEQAGIGTLLVDLLTEEEERADLETGQLRFDLDLLSGRLVAIVDWLADQPETSQLPLGLFGASTGAGAALVAAAERPDRVTCVVSRGGRPDLARHHLADVAAPTLLIVGDRDTQVLELNRSAMTQLPGEKELVTVLGATHLFEEQGALEEVAQLATAWFLEHLGGKN